MTTDTEAPKGRRLERLVRRRRLNMAITGGFGTLIDLVTGRPRRWYMRADGIKRWVSNDQPYDASNESDLWRCTECGRIGSVGRCCGDETREPVRTPNADLSGRTRSA